MIMKLKNQRPGPKGAVEPVKKYTGFLSINVCAAGYALTYATTPKLQSAERS
jgi:hypothetical protein